MSDEIIKALDDLSQRFGIAVDWTSSNVLPYLQELTQKYVNYRLVMSVKGLVIEVLLFMIAVKLVKAAKTQYHKVMSNEASYYNGNDDFCMIIGIACGIGAVTVIIIDFILIPSTLGDIITCMMFPEKLILDVLLQVLKNQ